MAAMITPTEIPAVATVLNLPCSSSDAAVPEVMQDVVGADPVELLWTFVSPA